MSDAVNDSDADACDVAAARTGDHRAFARLYDRHAAVVLSLCRRFSPVEVDAQDAMQETFIRAHRLLGSLNGTTGLRPWLYAIARRVCSERNRAARRRASHESAAAHSPGLMGHQAEPSEGEARSEQEEDLRRLDQALSQLDEREQLAVHLYYLDADHVAAAMSALGVSRSGYYKLLQQARERLSQLMRKVTP